MNKDSIRNQAEELAKINSSIKSSTKVDEKLLTRRDELTKSLKKAAEDTKSSKQPPTISEKESITKQAEKLAELNKAMKSCKIGEEKEKMKQESIAISKTLKDDAEKLKSKQASKISQKPEVSSKNISSSQKAQEVSITGSQSALDKLNQNITSSVQNKGSKSSSIDVRADIAFLIDATGSMQPWINTVKSKVKYFIKSLAEEFGGIKCRAAYVAYRDFDMGARNYEIFDFTDKPEELENSLANLKAMGGADGPEDINGGLQVALSKLNWKASTKVLVHFADAPCHGGEFHDLPDSFSNPKTDIPWDQLMYNIRKNGIFYNFLELNPQLTKKMTDKFTALWENALQKSSSIKGNAATFKVYPVDSANFTDLVPKIEKSIKESVNRSIKSMTCPEDIMKKLGV